MTETLTRPVTTIRKSVFLATGAETVWAHLTRADKLGTWFHRAEEDLAEGRDFALLSDTDGSKICWGKVVEMRRPDRMVWEFTAGPMNGRLTRVESRIEPAPGGVRLSLEHSGLPEDADGFGLILALDNGWHGFLANLRTATDA